MSIKQYQNILIINTFGIGDVLFTTPLIANLKQAMPQCQIGFIANARTAEIMRHHQDISDVFVYERDEFKEAYRRSKIGFWRKAVQFIEDIRGKKYDCVIDLSLNSQSGLFMSLAGIPERVGFDFKGRGRFLTQKIPLKGFSGKHVVEHYLDLLKFLGIEPEPKPMVFPLTEDERRWAKDFFQEHRIQGQTAFAFVPGGGASWGGEADLKRWPAAYFAELAHKFVEKFKAQIILVGSVAEQELAQGIEERLQGKVFNITGQTTLGQSAALFAQCRCVVTNDGGPLHMAVAAGAQTLSIFGPVDQRVYGPYPVNGQVVATSSIFCRPCYRRSRVASCEHRHCLKQLSVQQVLQFAEQIV